jgi:peroxiredoxin
LAFPAVAALPEGATAPGFTTQASLAGKTFTYSLEDALKRGPVVVYFYPSAFTGGCNAQAHAFSENKEKFTAAGATIIGVSLDSIVKAQRLLRRSGILPLARLRWRPTSTAR